MKERQLQYIVTIAKEGGIQRASTFLRRNPSTLTRAVKLCEEMYQVPVFLRTGEGMTLTPEGEVITAFFEQILNQLNELRLWIGRDTEYEWSGNVIHYLLVIREQKNISRAAQELFLAQPSLSQMLLELEDAFEQPLFIRNREGVEETIFGAQVLDRLAEIEETRRQLKRELEEFQELKRGSLSIGIPLNLGSYLLPQILPVFARHYPGIEVKIRENNSQEIGHLLLGKKIDFGIMHYHETQESIRYEMLLDDPFCLVIPVQEKANYKLPKDRSLTARDLQLLAEKPFIMVASRQKLRLVVDEILERAQIKPQIRYTTKSMETAKRLVAAGLGITMLPHSYLTLYSGVEDLDYYPLDADLNASWELVVACLEEEKLSRSAREFLRLLREVLLNRKQ